MPATKAETPEFAAMLRRMIRAHARRVANGDEVDLAEMLDLQRELDDGIRAAVHGMRDQGIAWQYIADGAGITRQAAWKRWGPYPNGKHDG